jgi:hypothetical protein
VVIEDLVCAVEDKIHENRQFTISSLSLHFLQISCHFFTKVSEKLSFRKLRSCWVPKMLTDKHKMKRGMLSRGVVMFHDNARPHTAATMQHLIMTFGWEQFNHLQPRVRVKCVPASENFPWWLAAPRQ